jgi:hypothetical protein
VKAVQVATKNPCRLANVGHKPCYTCADTTLDSSQCLVATRNSFGWLADQKRTGQKRQFVEPSLMDRQVAIAKGVFEPTPLVAENAAFYWPDRAKRCRFGAVG